jgi:hypothetical protein
MRRILVVTAAGLMLLGAACGSGGADTKTNASNTGNNNTGAAAAAASFYTVCDSRAAVSMGSAYASAASQTGVNYATVSDGLRRARDAAPSELKDDYSILVEAEVPFFEVLAKANGNYMSAAQDPAFQAAAEKMQDPKVQAAAKNLSTWFEDHCN